MRNISSNTKKYKGLLQKLNNRLTFYEERNKINIYNRWLYRFLSKKQVGNQDGSNNSEEISNQPKGDCIAAVFYPNRAKIQGDYIKSSIGRAVKNTG